MSLAHKCDRCGAFYERSYEVSERNLFRIKETKTEHMEFDFDLCPECYKHVEDYLLSHENNRVRQYEKKKGKKK